MGYTAVMEIGGNDIIVPVAMTLQRLERMLAVVRARWPEAQIEDAKGNCPLALPLTIPFELHVHKDAAIKALSDEKGVVPEVEPFFFSIYAFSDELTLVVGPDGSEGEQLGQEIVQLLRSAV